MSGKLRYHNSTGMASCCYCWDRCLGNSIAKVFLLSNESTVNKIQFNAIKRRDLHKSLFKGPVNSGSTVTMNGKPGNEARPKCWLMVSVDFDRCIDSNIMYM